MEPFDYKLLLLPIIGAIIGWITNYFAIKMLFKPYKPIKLLGFTIQGVIPKRRAEFTHGLAKTIESQLLSSKDISDILEGAQWEEEVEKTIEGIISEAIRTESMKKYPIVGVVSDSILNAVKYYVSKELVKQIDKRKPALLDKFHDKVNVKELVLQKVDTFDIQKLENVVFSLIEKELRHIEVTGAVLGFIIGSVQVLIVMFL